MCGTLRKKKSGLFAKFASVDYSVFAVDFDDFKFLCLKEKKRFDSETAEYFLDQN